MGGQANASVKRLALRERFFTPVLILFVVMTLSWLGYNLAWRLESATLHRVLASVSGTLLFLSVALGTLVVYWTAYFRGASLKERIAASLINPFLWATKECLRLSVSFSFFECVYYYANPLNVWLVFGIAAEMALAEIVCRQRQRSQGADIRVLHPSAVTVLLISLSLVVSLYTWGEGENVYAIFLEGYRVLFGAGTGVGVTL
jgi:hypothetical protein